jgi:hypothetical protein
MGLTAKGSSMSVLGPFCQSCGMPLNQPADFGTSAGGQRVNDYCQYCYENGRFTQPDLTLEEMVARCTQLLVAQGATPEPAARALMADALPRLKRWREPEAARSEGRGFIGGDEIC